jgi:hypothetical protein
MVAPRKTTYSLSGVKYKPIGIDGKANYIFVRANIANKISHP